MHRSSISKSDNLNHFLKYSNAKFDYLLIADADESFDINTVQCNIRFFYSNRFERLAFVTPMNQCYKTSNIYTNVCRCLDNNTMFLRDSMKSVLHKDYSNLYSASSLISGNFLKYIGNKFPDTVLEDYYTENTAALHG
jgi:hypothetical protein